MEQYDVIIIGAGPGGLNCAKILGAAKKKVLLLEKNPEIGPKICAGGLTRKSYSYLNLPPDLIEHAYAELVFNAPHVKTIIKFPQHYFYTIDRKKIGQWQLSKLDKNYVTVRTSATVTQITRDHIEINHSEKIGYTTLVGADGSASIVKRYLKLKSDLIGVAIQYLLPTEKYKKFELFFDSNSFSAWYSWIFPHQNYVSIGYGYPAKRLSPQIMEKNFFCWLEKNQIDISQAKREAFPINCDYQGFKFGNIFLLGDAAGLASGFTGEGIYQALVSGEDVARTILDKKHKPEKISAVLHERNYHHFLLRIVAFSGPLRNIVFDFVAICVKNKLLSRTLVRILS